MYPAMRGADDWTVIYFILITVIGNFMLFNLFVAIIITGFSENKADILKEEKVHHGVFFLFQTATHTATHITAFPLSNCKHTAPFPLSFPFPGKRRDAGAR